MPQSLELPQRRWSPATHAALLDLLEGPAAGCALDWDETCMTGDISLAMTLDRPDGEAIARTYDERERVDLRGAWRWLTGTLLEGRTPEAIADEARATLARHQALSVVPEMRDLTHALVARGWEVWVVTGSPQAVVAAIAPQLGLPPERVLGMDCTLAASGQYTNEVREPITEGPGKLELLRQHTSTPLGLAAGDRPSDAWLLREASTALVIDRGDPVLKTEAERRGWLVQEAW